LHRVWSFCLGLAKDCDLPTYASWVAGIIDVYLHTQLIFLRWNLARFFAKAGLELQSSPNVTSLVAGITGMSHYAWLVAIAFKAWLLQSGQNKHGSVSPNLFSTCRKQELPLWGRNGFPILNPVPVPSLDWCFLCPVAARAQPPSPACTQQTVKPQVEWRMGRCLGNRAYVQR
jgi:hypothetical protein